MGIFLLTIDVLCGIVTKVSNHLQFNNMNKIIPVLFVASAITLFGLSKIRDTFPVDFNTEVQQPKKLQQSTEPKQIPLSKSVDYMYKDKNGKPLFYTSYDAKTKKSIKVQYAMVLPLNYNPKTYDKPIVVLGHDGYDKAQKPDWDKEMKGDLNYLVKNMYRLAAPIAQEGSIVIIPAYRGENQSQGKIDVAGGDVMDTIAAIRFVKSQLPNTNQSAITLSGTSRGALTSVMTASVYPVNKVVIGYGVMDIANWNNNEANCGSDKNCITKRDIIYGKYTSWDQILDAKAIKTAKDNNGGKLPNFTRSGINITHYANSKTGIYIGQGLNDKSVKPYNAFKYVTALNKLQIPNALDVFYGKHSVPTDGTHGIYTRDITKYVSDSKGRGATAIDLKAKFVEEATTEALPTALLETPIVELQTQLGVNTLAKVEGK
jgi:dipeptidyl aminopeptidase/acylaminoacyl peptidase